MNYWWNPQHIPAPVGNSIPATPSGTANTPGTTGTQQGPRPEVRQNHFGYNLPTAPNRAGEWQSNQFSAVLPFQLLQTAAAVTHAANAGTSYFPGNPVPHAGANAGVAPGSGPYWQQHLPATVQDRFAGMSPEQFRRVPGRDLFNMPLPPSTHVPSSAPVRLRPAGPPQAWSQAGLDLKASARMIGTREDKRQVARDLFDGLYKNAKEGHPNLVIAGDIHQSMGALQMMKDDIDEACSDRGRQLGMDTLYMELSRNRKHAQHNNLLGMLEAMTRSGGPVSYLRAAHLKPPQEIQAIHNAEILRYAAEKGMRIKFVDTKGDAFRAAMPQRLRQLEATLDLEQRDPTSEEITAISGLDERGDAMAQEVMRDMAKGHNGILCVGSRHVPRLQQYMTTANVNAAAVQVADEETGLHPEYWTSEIGKYPDAAKTTRLLWLSPHGDTYQ